MKYARRVGTFKAGSPEWHAARATGLGGSEIAAVLGLSPWTSKFTLWHRKVGLAEPEPDNKGMSWGRRLEDPIAQAFAEGHPEFRPSKTGTWCSKARPWQIANPDRLLKGAILEVKTAHSMDSWEWGEQGTDQIPVYYRCQGLWYLDVFGFDTCHFAVLIGGSDYREYVLHYDLKDVVAMRDAGEQFLTSLDSGERPSIDESDSTYQTVRELHPHIDGSDFEVPYVLAQPYLSAIELYHVAKAVKQRRSAELLDAMGEARYATFEGERIAMRAARGNGVPYLRSLVTEDRKAA